MSQPGALLEGLHIVIVEDDDDSRDMLTYLLQSHGAHVVARPNAMDALGVLRVMEPAVLISDIAMPEHDGYWLLGEVRRDARFARMPAIAVSGHTAYQDERQSREAGFTCHVPKPIDVDQLCQLIAVLARERHADTPVSVTTRPWCPHCESQEIAVERKPTTTPSVRLMRCTACRKTFHLFTS